jgi:hypothetical protein
MMIDDEYMKRRLTQARTYTLVILHKTAKMADDGARAIVWEHGRRNMALQAEGTMPLVFPVGDETDISGVAVFLGTPDEVREIMDGDPGVTAGLFTYEVHACRGFPGSALPG